MIVRIIIYYSLLIFLIISCTRNNQNESSKMLLHWVELQKNSIENEHTYMSAQYYLYCCDNKYEIPFKKEQLYIDGFKISDIETKLIKNDTTVYKGCICDSIKLFSVFVFVDKKITKNEFISKVQKSILVDSLYLKSNEENRKLKIEVLNKNCVIFSAPYRIGW